LLHLEPPTASASLPASACSAAAPRAPASVRPLAPARYHLQVTISAETRDKLRRAQDLLRHVVPDGDPATILDRALTLLVDRLERDRARKTTRPKTASRASAVPPAGADPVVWRAFHRSDEAHTDEPVRPSKPTSGANSTMTRDKAAAGLHEPVGRPGRGSSPSCRHRRSVPAATVRAVWQRDEGRCTFVGAEGRCRETAFLELHHLVPVAWGGPSTEANITLRCRPHNQGDAIRDFGVDAVVNGRDAARRRKETAGSTLFEPS
jgi:hypothetical protein